LIVLIYAVFIDKIETEKKERGIKQTWTAIVLKQYRETKTNPPPRFPKKPKTPPSPKIDSFYHTPVDGTNCERVVFLGKKEKKKKQENKYLREDDEV